MVKITKTKFKKAMEGSAGILANIAKRLNVTRGAITLFVQRHKDIQELLDQEDESINDLAEAKLIQKLNDGDMKAIRFRLQTKAKNRGYVERQEVYSNVNDMTTDAQAYRELLLNQNLDYDKPRPKKKRDTK
jgi:hypothetical protein